MKAAHTRRRYTECRLQALSSAVFLSDLGFGTVDTVPTFDGSEQEPTVLPARLPHLLINGTAGIAVGIATRIPPHNLREVVSGLRALIADPAISLQGLMRHIPAPDFPTGVQPTPRCTATHGQYNVLRVSDSELGASDW